MHIRPFEIAFLGFFAIAAIAAVFFLRGAETDSQDECAVYGSGLTIWGTFSKSVFDKHLTNFRSGNKCLDLVSYSQVDERSFQSTLVNAIAEGRSPDLVILPHSLIVSERGKLAPISYETITVRDYKDTYIDGAEIFARTDGIYGIPFAVDPLVMYWNRDLFASAGLATPPKTWETLVGETTKALTRVNDRREIAQSAIAFGEYANVAHAKEVISMLFLQAGSSLVDETRVGERQISYRVTLNNSHANSLSTGDAVLFFYTQFATPSRDLYTWNRSQGLDRTEFLGGTLALYFGKASEYGELLRENPNLNFDVAPVPQGNDATILRNYGDFYAFSIPKGTRNPVAAMLLARYLGSVESAQALASAYAMAPVHRSALGEVSDDPVKNIVYKSALISRGWLDPDPARTSELFKEMVEDIVSHTDQRIGDIIDDTLYQLENLF